MKQVTLTIPDSKFDFFMDLVRQLNLEKQEMDVISALGESPIFSIFHTSLDPNKWERKDD